MYPTDLRARRRDVGDAAGVGQVDVPLGIRHDRVSLHHGAVARAAGVEAIAPVGDDPVALAADGLAAGARRVAADGHPPGLDERHAIARVAADRVILDLRAGHDARDVDALLGAVLDLIPQHGIAAGRPDGHARPAAVEDRVLQGGQRTSDGGGRRPGVDQDPAERVAKVPGTLAVGPDVGVNDHIVVGRADDRDPVPEVLRDRHLRLDRGLEAADGVAVGVTVDLDAVAAIGNARLDVGIGPDGGLGHLDPGRLAADLDAVAAVPRNDAGADQVVPALGSDQDPVAEVRGRAPEGEGPGEGIERGEAAGRLAHLDAVLPVAGDHVAQGDHAADLRVAGASRDQQAVAAIGDDPCVVGPDAQEIGLDCGGAGIGDPQAVAAVAAEHVVVDERRILDGAADQLISIRVHDGHAVLSVAQGRIARGGRADEVPAHRVLGGPARNEHAVALVARDQVALGRTDDHALRGVVAAGHRAADQVPGRALGDEDAVLGVAALERTGGVGADVVHGDLIVRGPVDPDPVAAVAADHIGELGLEVDCRLVRDDARAGVDDADDLVAGHGIIGLQARGTGVVQIDPGGGTE